MAPASRPLPTVPFLQAEDEAEVPFNARRNPGSMA